MPNMHLLGHTKDGTPSFLPGNGGIYVKRLILIKERRSPMASLSTVLAQAQLRKFPIISLESVAEPGLPELYVTYHIYDGSLFAKATWTVTPSVLYINELNRLLNITGPDPIMTYLYGLSVEERDRILAEAVVAILRFNPTIFVQVGIPIDLIARR